MARTIPSSIPSHTNGLTPALIRSHLRTNSFGKGAIHCFREIPSTNDVARRLAMEGCPEGTLVVAESQTAGRGRLHRTWESPRGGLYFSLVLRPQFPPSAVPRITLLAGVAVCRAIKDEANVDAAIKWPNDVLIHGKKVAGILTEMEGSEEGVRHAIVGIGINLNTDPSSFPPELRQRAGSILGETKRVLSREAVLAAVLTEMEGLWGELLRQGFEPVRLAWKSLSETLGRTVRFDINGQEIGGVAFDLDHDGGLLVRGPDGVIHRVCSGEVS